MKRHGAGCGDGVANVMEYGFLLIHMSKIQGRKAVAGDMALRSGS
jgi:hypothetical protein